jgi:uncharacterized protein YdaU (DUF1376 family)
VNYYKRHLGDYAAATRHLSLLEHGVYTLLLDWYYVNERPLPADEAAVARLVGARSKDERSAVSQILREFFDLRESGWHHARCDAEIAEAAELGAEGEARKENERERQRRHRQRRKELFEELRKHGEVPPFETATNILEGMLSRVTGRDRTSTSPEPVTHVTPDATAIHKPIAISQELRAADAASGGQSADPRKQLWDIGVSILGDKSRSLIGAACKRVGEAKVAEVLAQMATSTKAEPTAWFIAATTERERKFQC